MISTFAQNIQIRPQTLAAWNRFHGSQDIAAMVNFFCLYFQDVAPPGLTVHHVPVNAADRPQFGINREQIQLKTEAGKIFMCGLISLEEKHTNLERTAGDEAYTKFLNGEFTPDGDNWRFFTGHPRMIRFFGSRDEDEWAAEGRFFFFQDKEAVATLLHEGFSKIQV